MLSVRQELAPHYFPADCFGGSSDLAGTGSTLFSCRLFWRWLRFGGNWHHSIFWRIVLEAAQIWRELAPHHFRADCFGGSSDLAGIGITLISYGLFWRQLRFCGNWLHIIFQRIIFEEFQIWWELAPQYFWADCFGGSSDLAGTGSTFYSAYCFGGSSDLAGTGSTVFSTGLFLEAAQIWRELAPKYFLADCFGLIWRQL